MPPSLLAHQSDWLSMVLVCIPLGIFAALLALANHRALRDGPVDLTPPVRRSQLTRQMSAPTDESLPTKSS